LACFYTCGPVGTCDYLLPNLRFFDQVTPLGYRHVPIYVYEVQVIRHCVALALTDDRTFKIWVSKYISNYSTHSDADAGDAATRLPRLPLHFLGL
jgi:hypothetical protein